MSTDQRRTVHIQDLSRSGCPVWVRVVEEPQRGALCGSVDYVHATRDLGRANDGGRVVTSQEMADKLLARYAADRRPATADDCENAVVGMCRALDLFTDVATRPLGHIEMRPYLPQVEEMERQLCELITDIRMYNPTHAIEDAAE